MDIKGFFMAIDKQILRDMINYFILKNLEKLEIDSTFLLNLINQLLFHDPTLSYYFKGEKLDYENLPDDKSLFHS
jgi:hypothetical protein